MFIQTEETPNPQTLKFIPGNKVLERGLMEFKSKEDAEASILAKNLFDNENITNIFYGADFITVTKTDKMDWELLKPEILSKIMDFFSSGLPILNDKKLNDEVEETFDEKDAKVVEQIKNLLDEKIKPAVAQDGGDIRFIKFDDGVVFLELRGACAGCPSSTLTLKSGIENMLKYYVPEIVSVEAIN